MRLGLPHAIAAGALMVASAAVYAVIVRSSPPTPTVAATAEPLDPRLPLPSASAADPTAAKKAKFDRLRTQSAGLESGQRMAWLRTCAEQRKCDADAIDAIIAGAPPRDRESLMLASMAVAAERFGRRGTDGTAAAIEPITDLCDVFEDSGLAVIPHLRTSTLRDAKKDPDGARGGAIQAQGTVAEIRTNKGGITEGTLVTGDGTFVRFITPMATDGIYDGSWASFAGVFVQEYAFANVSGGQTRALLLVGAFDVPKNKRGSRPPKT